MTWNTPPSVPSSGSTALLPAGQLTLGEIASGAWRVYKARFGLFVKLLLMPFLLMLGATLILALVLAGIRLADTRNVSGALPPAVIGALALFSIAVLLISLLQYVYQGRTVIAGNDLATGRETPTGANLADRTRGMLGRVLILVLIGFALSIVVVLVLAAILVPISMAGSNSTGGGGGGAIGLLLMPVLYVGIIWLSVKLTYTIPAMAEEGLGAWDAIKRSFAVTQGAFWKTLGYQIVLAMIALALMVIPYIILMVSAFGLGRDGQPSPAGMVGLVIGVIALYGVLILVVPYQYIFTGLMYLSRTRERGEVGSVWGAGANGQNPPYGQQGYPQQGYPQQGYPQQGPGSTPQG